jgi:hypothetical protein
MLRQTILKRFTIAKSLAAIAVAAILWSCTVAIWQSIGVRAHYARQLETRIEQLYAKRPENLTVEQWNCLVDWTCNLHGNSLVAFECNTGEIIAFESRLSEALSGTVDASTIEWIWDEYAKLCHAGQSYQRFRLMVNENLARLDSPVMLESHMHNVADNHRLQRSP